MDRSCFNDDYMSSDIGEGLRLANYENADQSLFSDAELKISELQLPRHNPVEQDRFIPHRYNNSAQSSNFEAKELLFSKTQFNCTHSANE